MREAIMMKRITESSPRKTARMAGFLYLIFMVTLIFSTFVRSRLIVSGDAAATAKSIMASEGLFRIGFVSELLSAAVFLSAAWALYVLLRPVNRNLALLFVLLNLGGVAIECANALNEYAALRLLSGAGYLKAFSANQLQAMAMSFLKSYDDGFVVAQIFYGAWLFPLGYLVFKSGSLPRILGLLLIIDCFAVLVWFSQHFLFPHYAVISYPCFAESFIAELGLALWLLIKGVKDQKPSLIEAS
jgi:hypothetical protein